MQMLQRRYAKLVLVLIAVGAFSHATSRPLDIVYSHGISYIEPLKYPSDFTHFEYVNPNAPKGGYLRTPNLGNWDNFNEIPERGRAVLATRMADNRALIYDRLMEHALDEFEAHYGRLAEGIWVADDYSQFAFKLRDNAVWHDGRPITVEDVIFTFMTMKDVGGAGVRSTLWELDRVEKIGEREVLFTTKSGTKNNPDLAVAVGRYSIMPKHFWATRDITKTTIEPPLGSGPYRIESYEIGRNIVLKLDPNYWGRDIPVNKGRYNFDRVKWDYFRDDFVVFEALKGGIINISHESEAKNWATAYTFPAFNEGYVKRELVQLSKPWGLWYPVTWNMNSPKFKDIRVREALWLLSEFNYYNRVLMFDFFNYAKSYFYGSKMASSGLPSPKELELLTPWRGQIPDRVFTHEWVGNETSGYGFDRDNVKRSLELFEEAGWEIIDGVMTNVETGEPFTIEFVFHLARQLRQETPFIGMLNMIGIETTARTVEYSNWLYRMRSGSFEATALRFLPTNMPGVMLRNNLSSASARSTGGQNWGRIQNPAIDALIEHVMAARSAEDFYAAVHALDRILLWSFYRIPSMGVPGFRMVYWDNFGKPDYDKPLYIAAWLDTWWWDEAKAERVRLGMPELAGK